MQPILLLPLLFGCAAAAAFFDYAKKTKALGFLAYVGGFVLYVVASLAGELASHTIFPSFYEGIGDNPGQIGGLLIVWFLAPIIVTAIFVVYRKKKP